MIRIRLIDSLEYEDELQDLHKACFDADPVADFHNGYWWLGFDHDIPIAFAGMNPSAYWRDTGYLCRSGVLPEYRGHGIQKRLIRARIKYAKSLGWKSLITDTYNNLPSGNSLISCGFKFYQPSNPWSFCGALYWLKRL